ncbi:glycosyltransferase family 2 protein [Candidatus Parcubacteria bacterium]|nr:MAG: glycosyltransferase family 2 protein [Candidatus Parcubacteria bacterium]
MSNKNNLSVVISAYNEQKHIKDCLESVRDLADEIIFIDNTSEDDTLKIAKKYTDKVFTHPNNPMLNINKNYGFTKASCDWILNLDADERVTSELANEIREVIGCKSQVTSHKPIQGYWIPRKNMIFGKWIQNDMWWPDYQLRLFKKGKGSFPEQHVHEYLTVQGETEKLRESILHINYSSIDQFINKIGLYTDNETEQVLSSGRKIIWLDAIRFPAKDFIKTFFAQKGYRDGLHGLVLSILQAFYAEIVFVKIWEKQGFTEENNKTFLKEVYKEFIKIALEIRYWFLSILIEQASNPFKKIFYRLQRKNITRKLK